LTGKVQIFSKNGQNLFKKFEQFYIFCPGPAFWSATPGPASALYAPVCDVLIYDGAVDEASFRSFPVVM